MIEKIAPFIMITVTTWLIVMLLNNLMKYRFKRRIIETNMNDENLISLILESKKDDPEERKIKLLKWIFISFFGGIGLIVQEFLPYKMDESILPYGVLSIFLSIGLLLYYLIIHYFFRKPS
jgi:purine-cytosine permease-like protein